MVAHLRQGTIPTCALKISKDTPSELKLVLASDGQVLKSVLGIALLGALGGAFLYMGLQTVTVDCVRAQAGAAPDCQVLTRHVLGAYSGVERITGVLDVEYRTNTDRARGGGRRTTNRVELVSSVAAVSLGAGSSNLNDREKAHAVSLIRQYLGSPEMGEFHLEVNLANAFGGIGLLLCALVAWFLWKTAMGLAFPAMLHLVRGNGKLRVRANPGKGPKYYDLGRIESVRVLEGEGALPKKLQHGTSALRIGLAGGGEVIIPSRVPENQLGVAVERIREFLGLADSTAQEQQAPKAPPAAVLELIPESSVSFQLGSPLLRRIGGGVGLVGLVLLLIGATKFASSELLPAFFAGLPWIVPALFLLKGAWTLLLVQEVTVDSPVIRVRRQVLGSAVSSEAIVSSFREIRLERRRTRNGEWARATLVHGSEKRRDLVFVQGAKVAESVSACERMSRLTGLPISGA